MSRPILFESRIILRNIGYTFLMKVTISQNTIKFNVIGFDYSIRAGFLREYKVENDSRVMLTRDIIFKSTERRGGKNRSGNVGPSREPPTNPTGLSYVSTPENRVDAITFLFYRAISDVIAGLGFLFHFPSSDNATLRAWDTEAR